MTNPTTDEMAREVFEFFTGKCWHEYPVCLTCDKCGELWTRHVSFANPPLAESLDAWRPIWEAMTREQLMKHWENLMDIFDGCAFVISHSFEATPMHHLTAAYNVVKGE